MQGRHIGRLQISLALFNDEGDMTEVSNPLFLKDGEQSPEWQHSMVNVDENQHDFVLFFTAVRGNGYESDIGIDDIELFEEACEVVQERKPTVRLEIVKLEVFTRFNISQLIFLLPVIFSLNFIYITIF